jgi:glycosyltransferase involved in cell wall biosynthesis
MKVLLVGKSNSNGTDGGSHSFLKTLLAGFSDFKSSHEFFYAEPGTDKTPIKLLVKNYSIDLVWFLSPYYEETDSPFAITVWDVAQRITPFFPELSVTGWTFDSRELFYKSVLPKATFVITGSLIGARQINEFYGVPINNIKIIPLPVNNFVGSQANSDVLNKYQLEPQNYIFYPAQFWPHKNHITIIDAFNIAKESFHNFKLVFTGSDKGNLDYVKKYSQRLNLSNHILYLGFVDTDLINSLYANAFALVYGSCIGPDNIPPLEAMVFKCPTVCSRFEGAYEQLGDACLYFDPTDPLQAGQAIIKLKDPAVRLELQVKGCDLIRELDGNSYCLKMNKIIDGFIAYRRLWSSGSEYKHT